MGRRGERRGVARRSGLEGAEELEMEVGVELALELELELELELGLPTAASVDVGEAVHKSFIKPVHHSAFHKSVHNAFMTVLVLLTPKNERNMNANNNRQTAYH